MGTGGTPTIPLFIGQGAFGELEWTPGDQPGIWAGDGVMIAGDVRTLARGYCANGTAVYYEEYEALSHITSIAIWLPNSTAWIKERFAGLPTPQNCSSIRPGNPLEPIPMPSPAAKPSHLSRRSDGHAAAPQELQTPTRPTADKVAVLTTSDEPMAQ